MCPIFPLTSVQVNLLPWWLRDTMPELRKVSHPKWDQYVPVFHHGVQSSYLEHHDHRHSAGDVVFICVRASLPNSSRNGVSCGGRRVEKMS